MKSITTINNVAILVDENSGKKLVPVKPICEALGIDAKNQRDKIQNDEILAPVGVLSTSTGADGKKYEMYCLPAELIFGWLFTINPKNVKPEAQEAVLKYKMECYYALYNHFVTKLELQYKKSLEEIQLNEEYEKAREAKNQATKLFKDVETRIKKFREDRLAELSSDAVQMPLFS